MRIFLETIGAVAFLVMVAILLFTVYDRLAWVSEFRETWEKKGGLSADLAWQKIRVTDLEEKLKSEANRIDSRLSLLRQEVTSGSELVAKFILDLEKAQSTSIRKKK